MYCLEKGEIYNKTRIYPPKQSVRFRKTEVWALEAESSGKAKFGVKGRGSIGQHIELPQRIPVDYMHFILEGVKQLTKAGLNRILWPTILSL